METLIIPALAGALLITMGFGALAFDRWQQRRRRTDSK